MYKVKFKPFVSLICALALVVSVVTNVNPVTATGTTLYDDSKINVEVLEEKENYQKVMFTYKDTGVAETVEYSKNGETMTYVVTGKDRQDVIENKNGRVYMNGAVIADTVTTVQGNEKRRDLADRGNGIESGPIFWRGPVGYRQGDVYTDYTNAAAIASILAAILGFPLTSTIIAIGALVFSDKIPRVWYKKYQYYNADDICQIREEGFFYRHSNFTGLLGIDYYHFRACRP